MGSRGPWHIFVCAEAVIWFEWVQSDGYRCRFEQAGCKLLELSSRDFPHPFQKSNRKFHVCYFRSDYFMASQKTPHWKVVQRLDWDIPDHLTTDQCIYWNQQIHRWQQSRPVCRK